MGSLLGLSGALIRLGFECIPVVPNSFPDSFKRISGSERLRVFESEPEQIEAELSGCDRIVTLDFNRLDRAGERLRSWLSGCKIEMGMIDHHEQPQDYAAWRCWETASPSSCELVWGALKASNWGDAVEREEAMWLYLGMVTDTGSFRFPSVRPNTHLCAAELIERGARPEKVHEAIFEGDAPRRLRLIGEAYRGMQVWEDLSAVVFSLDEAQLEQHGYQKGDTEGLVNHGLSLEGMKLSAFFVIREGKGKVSLRSKGELDVNALCAKLFEGGGHRNAAGGSFTGSIPNAISKLRGELEHITHSI